jgi:O-acetyl-ADP-ribose deacetylase (regulator of RNase III)
VAAAARVAVATVREVLHAEEDSTLDVVFCCFSPAALAAYEDLLAN